MADVALIGVGLVGSAWLNAFRRPALRSSPMTTGRRRSRIYPRPSRRGRRRHRGVSLFSACRIRTSWRR